MKSIALITAMVFAANVCLGEWEVLEVRTAPFTRVSYKGAPEMQMNLKIRNISEGPVFVWGQDFGTGQKFYLIESFIRGRTNAVWERQNVSMCGSIGQIGWIEVRPRKSIQSGGIILREYAGRQMLLTFRRASSKGDDKGSEVLLGPFTIPEPKQSEPNGATNGSQPFRSQTNSTQSAAGSRR
jgi:hypothetical protein